MSAAASFLEVEGLHAHFTLRRGLGTGRAIVRAVDGVSFTIARGEVLGLVGESGSGKTSVGRAVLRLIEPTAGRIRFDGGDVLALRGAALKSFRRRAQIVFQDPFASLNPRMTAERLVTEPLQVQRIGDGRGARLARAVRLLELVGLGEADLGRYPHQFSGGQRQRLAIARALAVEPELLVADEPVSALDVSIQAQIVNLLRELQRDLGLTLLFISHDLAVVEYLADRIAVMYLGRIVEISPARSFVRDAYHPYSRALLAAVPIPDPSQRRERKPLEGDMPSPLAPPSGCAFRTRCPFARDDCAKTTPSLRTIAPGHAHACLRDDLA